MTLNSVVNPWVYMMFNANLVESLERLFCPACYESRQNSRSGNVSLKKGILRSLKSQNIRTYEVQRPSVSPR